MPRAASALIGTLLLLAACGGTEVLVPTAPEPAPRLFLTAASEGGGFVLRDAGAPEGGQALCTSFYEVRAPAVHHEGTQVCFVGRLKPNTRWLLYIAPLDGGAPQAVKTSVDGDSAPAWLPDGRIVVSAPTADASRALFVVSPASNTAERITFAGTDARDPTVLRDGRILYAGTRTTPEGTRAPALFTVHPDGVGMLLFHGRTPGTSYARPRQGPNGDVAFLARSEGTVRVLFLDWRAPHEAAQPLAVPGTVVGAEADGDGRWLVATADGGLHSAAADTAAVPGPAWEGGARAFCSASRILRPQGYMSMCDPEKGAGTGTLLCIDAGRGIDGAAVAVRFHARMLQPDAGVYDWVALGQVPLAEDGSFFAKVPADTPLRLDVLDANGAVLRTQRTPIWVRPMETRGCTGCHDAPDTTPPNCQPQAVHEKPRAPQLPEAVR